MGKRFFHLVFFSTAYSLGVIFANSSTPDRRYKIFRNGEEISELPADSTDVFKRNMLNRYIGRPNVIFDTLL